MVEQWTENPCVGSSILPSTTCNPLKISGFIVSQHLTSPPFRPLPHAHTSCTKRAVFVLEHTKTGNSCTKRAVFVLEPTKTGHRQVLLSNLV